jgi:RNA polymerase sigma factor (sigma-70 family)
MGQRRPAVTPPEPSLSSAELSAHAAYLRALARGLLGREAEADDLVQDTFVAALEHPPRGPGGLRAWLATVARNRAMGLRRGAARRAAREADAARPEAGPDASEALERLELAQRLAAEVARLREPYRTAIYLRYHEGLAPSAIAARLGEPVKTVKTRLARSLELLRERIDAREGGREAWSAALLPFAFPLGASLEPAPAVSLAATITGGLAVKKLAIVLGAMLVLALAFQGLRAFRAPSSAGGTTSVAVGATLQGVAPAVEPAAVEVASASRTPLEVIAQPASPETGALVVTVVWADDGSPAEGVCAEVDVLDGGVPRADRLHGLTDAQGRARFAGLPVGRIAVYPPVGSLEKSTIAVGETTEVRLELGGTVVVEGRVVAPDGGPVGGARIRAERWDGKGHLGHVIGKSNPDGSFRLRGVDPESEISAAAPGWRPSLAFRAEELPVGARGAREVVLELGESGGRLAGRVLDAEGQPVAGAQVLAGPRGGGNQNLPSGQVAYQPYPELLFTDEDGQFEVVADLEPYDLPVEVIASGHPVWFGSAHVQRGERAWLEVQLERPSRIVGRVLDARGEAIAGASVRASREVGALRYFDRTPLPSARTDERGEFALDWVSTGEVEVSANLSTDQAAGRARARITCDPGGTHEVELRLDPEPALRGRVVDGDGQALVGWSVYWNSSQWHAMSPLHPGTLSSLGGYCVTGADGRFVIPNADDFLWDLSIAAPGEAPFPPRGERKNVRATGSELEIVIEDVDTESCVLVARLVDVDGRAPQDVQAALWDERHERGVHPEYEAATGVARWEINRPGRYAVQVWRGRRAVHIGEWVELRPGETTDLGAIVLSEPGEVVVEVSAPGAGSLEHVQVSIVPVGSIFELQLDPDGATFRAQGVGAGRYLLRAGHEALFAPEREIEVRPGEVVRLEVALVPAKPVEVSCEFPAAQAWTSVDWEAQDQGGTRVQSGRVRNWNDFPGARAPRIHGLALPPGHYTLVAATDTGLRAELEFEVADGRSARGPYVLGFHP